MDQETRESLLEWDRNRKPTHRFEAFWKTKRTDLVPEEIWSTEKDIWLDLGAGSGDYFTALAQHFSNIHFVPIERDRFRAKSLLKRAERLSLANLTALRGNVIPTLIHGIPTQTIDQIHILYPGPWPKESHRKHRWYFSPVMPHMVRILKEGGKLVWASDQQYYIEEAELVCTEKYHLKTLAFGTVQPNTHNQLDRFPNGRTKFEQTFFESNQPCYELIVQK